MPLRVDRRQPVHVPRGTNRLFNDRPDVLHDVERHAEGSHRIHDVRIQDGGIHPELAHGHHRHFRGQFGHCANFEERIFFFDFAVFGIIASRLAHVPDRHPVHRFPPAGAQKYVIVRHRSSSLLSPAGSRDRACGLCVLLLHSAKIPVLIIISQTLRISRRDGNDNDFFVTIITKRRLAVRQAPLGAWSDFLPLSLSSARRAVTSVSTLRAALRSSARCLPRCGRERRTCLQTGSARHRCPRPAWPRNSG